MKCKKQKLRFFMLKFLYFFMLALSSPSFGLFLMHICENSVKLFIECLAEKVKNYSFKFSI